MLVNIIVHVKQQHHPQDGGVATLNTTKLCAQLQCAHEWIDVMINHVTLRCALIRICELLLWTRTVGSLTEPEVHRAHTILFAAEFLLSPACGHRYFC